MNLRQEISFKSVKKGFGGNKGSKSVQLKTTINFVGVEEKKTNRTMLIPAIIVVIVLVLLFIRFAVWGRYHKLAMAREELVTMQEEIDEGMAVINDMDKNTAEFYHYTWSGMTEDEKTAPSRVSIAELIAYIDGQGLTVRSCSLSGDRLSVAVTGNSLEQISSVLADLRKRDLVESVSVSTAQTNEGEESAVGGVNAQMNIYIRPIDMSHEASEVVVTDDEGEVEE